ncbi:MAG: hypothetical protein SFY32_06310 [Bacteroidota bacterium]|nr:hypothetical protein [Bacteroidota bacterium]
MTENKEEPKPNNFENSLLSKDTTKYFSNSDYQLKIKISLDDKFQLYVGDSLIKVLSATFIDSSKLNANYSTQINDSWISKPISLIGAKYSYLYLLFTLPKLTNVDNTYKIELRSSNGKKIYITDVIIKSINKVVISSITPTVVTSKPNLTILTIKGTNLNAISKLDLINIYDDTDKIGFESKALTIANDSIAYFSLKVNRFPAFHKNILVIKNGPFTIYCRDTIIKTDYFYPNASKDISMEEGGFFTLITDIVSFKWKEAKLHIGDSIAKTAYYEYPIGGGEDEYGLAVPLGPGKYLLRPTYLAGSGQTYDIMPLYKEKYYLNILPTTKKYTSDSVCNQKIKFDVTLNWDTYNPYDELNYFVILNNKIYDPIISKIYPAHPDPITLEIKLSDEEYNLYKNTYIQPEVYYYLNNKNGYKLKLLSPNPNFKIKVK